MRSCLVFAWYEALTQKNTKPVAMTTAWWTHTSSAFDSPLSGLFTCLHGGWEATVFLCVCQRSLCITVLTPCNVCVCPQLTGLVMQVFVLYYGRLFIQRGQMTTGNLVSFILYQSNLGDNIRVSHNALCSIIYFHTTTAHIWHAKVLYYFWQDNSYNPWHHLCICW